MRIRGIVTIVTSGLVACGLSQAVLADEVQKTIDASPDGLVSVSNVSGSIEITGWARDQVDVVADLGSRVEELIVERSGDEVLVKVRTPNNGSHGTRADLVIRVPENSSIDVGAVSADIEVSAIYGEQRLHAVSGDIATEVYAADIQAEVVSGDIEVAGDDEPAFSMLSSVSGDIETSGLAGDIEMSSVSGDLVAFDGDFTRGQFNTVNGSIEFRARMADDSRLDMETINGSIDLHFVDGINARFDIETFNGSIRNCFGPRAERTSRYTPGQELKFTEGDGSGRVTLRTLNGRMDICKD